MTFEVKLFDNFCSHAPMDASDQVWAKSIEVCGRSSKLSQRKKETARTKELCVRRITNKQTLPWISVVDLNHVQTCSL